ncbi:hypothetical protein [Kocuria sp.]|uniref:hypothetical protein n=1 Tax=Kocuria sp. TaxID=1871328 RepID=UPI0028126F8C|nr:hypothetical protein [Kocuria sp.]
MPWPAPTGPACPLSGPRARVRGRPAPSFFPSNLAAAAGGGTRQLLKGHAVCPRLSVLVQMDFAGRVVILPDSA